MKIRSDKVIKNAAKMERRQPRKCLQCNDLILKYVIKYLWKY